MMISDPTSANGNLQAAGGYGPPGGGYPPPGGGGGYGGPPGGGPPPGGGGYGGPPPGGGGYGGPPGGGPPPGGGYGGPPQGGPPPGGFGQPPGFGPPGGFPPPGGPMMPGAGGDVNTTLPMILSGVGFFLCCGLASIFFLIGFIFAIQAGNMKKTGDIMGAQAKAKSAMTMTIIGGVLGVLGYIVAIILNIAQH